MNKIELAEKINSATVEYCEREKIYGRFRITLKDEIIYDGQYGWANVETKEEFTPESRFTFYSMSKPFCTMGLMKLVDKGLVDLDAHPSKYVPEAEKFDSRVTYRNMLFHRSGMPDPGQTPDFDKDRRPAPLDRIREDVRAVSEFPSLFVPGEGEWYANINMILPALTCENVSGMSYKDYMEKEVLRPLGMENTFVDNYPVRELPHRVRGHELNQFGEVVLKDRCTDWMMGAGDLCGTVDDVYCINKEIKNHKLLSDKAWDTILTPPYGEGYGMGCAVTTWHGKKRITHNGGHWGFRTMHVQLPEDDFDIIILSNSGYGNCRWDLTEMFYEICYGPDGDFGNQIKMDGAFVK